MNEDHSTQDGAAPAAGEANPGTAALASAESPAPAEPARPEPPPTFDALPLSEEVRKAIDEMGYLNPTPVQLAVWEPATRGRDAVVQARTGTGKTASFGLPIVDRIIHRNESGVQALVLCPTRELALQVLAEIERIAQYRGVKSVCVYGGASMERQVAALAAGAQLVVGTPGRVLDHIRRRTLHTSSIRLLVLDEADEMLSMGFERELASILEALPPTRAS
ncbi:MAG: DEAD/DEAH box helicase [Polyangiaceae bacterium]